MKVPFLGITLTGSVVLGTMTAIVLTGILLDEAGKGKLGTALQKIATKTTNGYGV